MRLSSPWVTESRSSAKGGPGAISQQVFQAFKIVRHSAVDERDPDAGIDGKPAVHPGEHVGGGYGVEQTLTREPADQATTDQLGECGQITLVDRLGRHEHRRDDVIGEVCGSLCHVATVAGRTVAAALAGEGHDESLAAARAPGAGESKAEEPAREIAAEFLFDVAGHGPLGGFPPGEPALEFLRHDPLERRLLGAAPLVAARGSMSPRPAAGWPGGAEAAQTELPRGAETRAAGRRQPAPGCETRPPTTPEAGGHASEGP